VRRLPVVKIGHKLYYADDRLQELRHINNPFSRISYVELYDMRDKLGYSGMTIIERISLGKELDKVEKVINYKF